MRRVLLFVVIFGAGLGILLLLRGRSSAPEGTAGDDGAPSPESQFTEIPLEAADGDRGRVDVLIQGTVDITQFQSEGEERKPIRRLHADDSESLGAGLYALRGMRIEILDPASGETTATLVSPRTRLKIGFIEGRPALGEDDKAFLSDVDATLLRNAPIVPLHFEVPLLEWRIATSRILSDQAVRISGAGLEARGDALEADLTAGDFVLPREGTIELALPDGVRATLASTGTGPIAVRSIVENGAKHVDLVASGGARLSATGEEPLQLDADEIRMVAREGEAGRAQLELNRIDARGSVVAVSRGDTFRADRAEFRVSPRGRLEHVDLLRSVALESGEGSLGGEKASFEFSSEGRPSSAHVDGSVVLRRDEDEFRSRVADFEFGPDGKLVRASLDGEPTGTVAIGRFLPAGQGDLRSAHAEVAGPGPLVLEFGDRTRFDLAGPGEVRVPEADLSIHAERTFHGDADLDRESGRLVAEGEVRVLWGGDELTSDWVSFETRRTPEGETVVEAEIPRSAHLSRRLDDGSVITLTAREGLSVRAVGPKLVVPMARGVDLEITGEDPLRAKAALVRDFDWDARSFTAEGDVSFESRHGSGAADRVVARGPEDVELQGTERVLAWFSRKGGAGETRFEEARIEGRHILARASRLEAEGDVRADFTASEASYHLEGEEVRIAFGEPASGEAGSPRPFEAVARTGVHAWVQTLRGESTLDCENLRIAGTTRGGGPESEEPHVAASEVRAEGNVVVDWIVQGGISGRGELFTLDAEGKGRLTAAPGELVEASGTLTPDSRPYELDAEWVEFDETRLEARSVHLRLRPDPPVGAEDLLRGSQTPLLSRLSADHLLANPKELLLEGSSHLDGKTQTGEAWSIDAGSIRVGGDFSRRRGYTPDDFEVVQAWGGFDARLGERGRARGLRLEGKEGRIRLEGAPAELWLGPIAMRSAWIEYQSENMLLGTDKGEIGPVDPQGAPWTIQYESLQPFDREDKTILALRNPVYREGDIELRALWMLFWIDREEWRRSGRKAVDESVETTDLRVESADAQGKTAGREGQAAAGRRSAKGLASLGEAIRRFRADPFSRILSEVYIEGNIELTDAGARRARASSFYLDVVEGHGWVRDADFLSEVDVRGREQQMRIRAAWLRVSSNLSLRADRATLTYCGYDEPHYVVETGDLRLEPNPGGKVPYNVSATRNALRFENGWAIPLPPIVYAEDEEGNPIIENLNLGQSAKFGASVGATFNVGLGKIGGGLGKVFESFLSLPKASVRGHWSFHADWLGSRGILLGTGLELKSGDNFRFETEFSAIPDGNEDKGLIRVDQDERSTLRDWFRGRGRYSVSKREWFDAAFSLQSDPGVQSEFFEGDFFRYEQKDNYLHWRKADGPWYYAASAKVLLEDRTDVEELPEAGIFRGRAPIGSVGGLDVLYTGSLDAAYLRRREGDTSFVVPGDPIPLGYQPFPDGLGDREVARVDTVQRLEAPFPLGIAGVRATPWTAVRATAWDQGVDPEDSPQRGSLLVGFDLSTTFWRGYGKRVLHTLSPFVSVHGDVATEESDGVPVTFDRTEDRIDGNFFDVGLRSRVWNPDNQARFDVEARTTYATDLPNDAPDGFRPVGVLAELLTWAGTVPVGISHDGRYDIENGDTVYSRSFLGFRPDPKWDVELGYHRGVDAGGTLLYEAVSGATRLRATKKWEIELQETISITDDRGLGSSFLLRRIGHDFVTEFELGYIAGEGSRFGINLTPLLTWRAGALGLLDRWLGR